MRIDDIQILTEEAVISSWIADLTFKRNRRNGFGDVYMTLNTGRRYVVVRVDEDLFLEWVTSMSKGKFWHSDIRGRYDVYRLP